MTIDQLLAAIGLTANDEIPLWDAEESGEPTKKITAQNLAAAVKLLASLLAKSDVKDSLSNTSIDYPLSANQGKVLNDKANTILSDIAAEYDNTATYALGDLCIYQNALYKCITAITTAEAWNATHWTATTLDDMTVKYGDVVNNLTSGETNPPSAGCVYDALSGFVKQRDNITGTTDTNGNVYVPTEQYPTKGLLFAWNGTNIFIPFYYNNNWYCRVQRTNAAGEAITNTSVTFSVLYI